MSRSTATESEIGTADAADADELANLAARTLREAWSAQAFRDLLRRPRCRALAARLPASATGADPALRLGSLTGRSDRVIGYVVGQRLIDELEIYSLAVDPDWRRNGLGRRLLAQVLERVRSEGVSRVSLEVRSSNAPARALYRGFGFRPEGQRPGYYADGEDALLLGAAL